MIKSLELKLLHFYTTGNIAEDFEAARIQKISKLRLLIRLCFYIHLAAAVVCAVLAAALCAGAAGIASTAVCEVILVGTAFLSVGDMTAFKVLLFCGDGAFAAAMFVTGALSGGKPAFFAIGAVSAVTTLAALGAFIAAYFRAYLENYSTESITREHFTRLPSLSSAAGADADDIPDIPDMPEEKIVAPPPRSEFRELADELKNILCSEERSAL